VGHRKNQPRNSLPLAGISAGHVPGYVEKMKIDIGQYIIRDWGKDDTPDFARHANNPKIAAERNNMRNALRSFVMSPLICIAFGSLVTKINGEPKRWM